MESNRLANSTSMCNSRKHAVAEKTEQTAPPSNSRNSHQPSRRTEKEDNCTLNMNINTRVSPINGEMPSSRRKTLGTRDTRKSSPSDDVIENRPIRSASDNNRKSLPAKSKSPIARGSNQGSVNIQQDILDASAIIADNKKRGTNTSSLINKKKHSLNTKYDKKLDKATDKNERNAGANDSTVFKYLYKRAERSRGRLCWNNREGIKTSVKNDESEEPIDGVTKSISLKLPKSISGDSAKSIHSKKSTKKRTSCGCAVVVLAVISVVFLVTTIILWQSHASNMFTHAGSFLEHKGRNLVGAILKRKVEYNVSNRQISQEFTILTEFALDKTLLRQHKNHQGSTRRSGEYIPQSLVEISFGSEFARVVADHYFNLDELTCEIDESFYSTAEEQLIYEQNNPLSSVYGENISFDDSEFDTATRSQSENNSGNSSQSENNSINTNSGWGGGAWSDVNGNGKIDKFEMEQRISSKNNKCVYRLRMDVVDWLTFQSELKTYLINKMRYNFPERMSEKNYKRYNNYMYKAGGSVISKTIYERCSFRLLFLDRGTQAKSVKGVFWDHRDMHFPVVPSLLPKYEAAKIREQDKSPAGNPNLFGFPQDYSEPDSFYFADLELHKHRAVMRQLNFEYNRYCTNPTPNKTDYESKWKKSKDSMLEEINRMEKLGKSDSSDVFMFVLLDSDSSHVNWKLEIEDDLSPQFLNDAQEHFHKFINRQWNSWWCADEGTFVCCPNNFKIYFFGCSEVQIEHATEISPHEYNNRMDGFKRNVNSHTYYNNRTAGFSTYHARGRRHSTRPLMDREIIYDGSCCCLGLYCFLVLFGLVLVIYAFSYCCCKAKERSDKSDSDDNLILLLLCVYCCCRSKRKKRTSSDGNEGEIIAGRKSDLENLLDPETRGTHGTTHDVLEDIAQVLNFHRSRASGVNNFAKSAPLNLQQFAPFNNNSLTLGNMVNAGTNSEALLNLPGNLSSSRKLSNLSATAVNTIAASMPLMSGHNGKGKLLTPTNMHNANNMFASPNISPADSDFNSRNNSRNEPRSKNSTRSKRSSRSNRNLVSDIHDTNDNEGIANKNTNVTPDDPQIKIVTASPRQSNKFEEEFPISANKPVPPSFLKSFGGSDEFDDMLLNSAFGNDLDSDNLTSSNIANLTNSEIEYLSNNLYSRGDSLDLQKVKQNKFKNNFLNTDSFDNLQTPENRNAMQNFRHTVGGDGFGRRGNSNRSPEFSNRNKNNSRRNHYSERLLRYQHSKSTSGSLTRGSTKESDIMTYDTPSKYGTPDKYNDNENREDTESRENTGQIVYPSVIIESPERDEEDRDIGSVEKYNVRDNNGRRMEEPSFFFGSEIEGQY